MHACMNQNPWNKSLVFCWKISLELATPIGKYLQRYFFHGRMIVHKLLAFFLSRIWQYPIFKSSDVTYWKPSNFNNISLIFGIGYGFRFNCLFTFLKSLRKRTQFDFGLDCAKDWAPHSESFDTSRTPSRTNRSTSFLKISLCTFGSAYVCESIYFAYYLIRSLLYLFYRYQVFHQTTLQISQLFYQFIALCYFQMLTLSYHNLM